MKTHLNAYTWALAGGAVSMLLRIWFLAVGTDEKGLYPTGHIAWILLCIAAAVVTAGLWWLTKQSKDDETDRPNPMYVALGRALAAIAMIVCGFVILSTNGSLRIPAAIVGILAGLVLLLSAGCHFMGRSLPFPAHLLPCFFFVIQIFRFGQLYGSEPEICRYLFHFLADLSTLPACYWLWSYDVDLGQNRNRNFWCMAAMYFNLIAMIGSQQWLFHLCVALWMFSTTPGLPFRFQKLIKKPIATAEEEAQILPPVPPVNTEDVVADVANHTPAVADIEHILDQILQEFGSDSTH